MYCKNCGNPVEDGAAVCTSCGTPITKSDSQKCAYCGNPVDPKASTCPSCGSQLRQTASYCKNCGNAMDVNSSICGSCGTPAGQGSGYCGNCGTQLSPGTNVCMSCGYAVQVQPAYSSGAVGEPKSKMAAGLLGIFLGGLGIHNFYLGNTGKGLAQLLISVLSCGFLSAISYILGLVEGILILTGTISTDAHGVPLKD